MHSLLQFNHSSHGQEPPPPPPPPPLPSAGTRTCCCTFLTDCLQHVGESGSGLERCRRCCELHRLHAVIRWATGLFYADFFPSSIRETPRHLAHIWSCLMRGRVCLSHYCERSNLEPSGDSGCLARAEPCRRVNDNSFCQELRGNI